MESVTNPTAETPTYGLAEAAEGLVDMLRAHGDEIDELGVLPQEVVRALDDAGLYRMAIPTQWGGLAPVSAAESAEVHYQLARGNASAAWSVVVDASGTLPVQYYGEPAATEVYVSEHVGPLTCGSVFNLAHAVGVGERADGGFLVRGNFAFSSNSRLARWLMGGFTCVEDDGTEKRYMALVPRSDFRVSDDWHVSGMKGTSSNGAFIPENVFVPDYRVMTLDEVWASAEEYWSVGRVIDLAMIIVGSAQAALEVFIERAPGRAPYGMPYRKVADMPTVHAMLGEADAAISAGRTALRAGARLIDESGGKESPEDSTRINMECLHISNVVRDAAENIRNAMGSSAAGERDLLGRFVRDAVTLCLHSMFRLDWGAEEHGRSLLGLDAPMPAAESSLSSAPNLEPPRRELIESDSRTTWYTPST